MTTGSDVPPPAPFALLTARQRRAYCRRLRLTWACGGDLRQVEAVLRMLKNARGGAWALP